MISGRVRYRRKCLCRAQSRAARWAVNGQTAVSAPRDSRAPGSASRSADSVACATRCPELRLVPAPPQAWQRARHGRQCPCRVLPRTGLGLAQRRRRSLRRANPRAPGSASRSADGVVCARESPSYVSCRLRRKLGSARHGRQRPCRALPRTGLGLAQRRRRSLRARIPEHRARPRATQTA